MKVKAGNSIISSREEKQQPFSLFASLQPVRLETLQVVSVDADADGVHWQVHSSRDGILLTDGRKRQTNWLLRMMLPSLKSDRRLEN